MDVLRDLNPQQQQAVMAGTGPVLVLAGPGSGKTRVLTQRIAYLIGQMGVRPYHVLAVTFTNKAAREMGDRVDRMLGQRGRGLTLGHFFLPVGVYCDVRQNIFLLIQIMLFSMLMTKFALSNKSSKI